MASLYHIGLPSVKNFFRRAGKIFVKSFSY
nr:MAG TPA: hypothetical protein [Caudoviricetes sp.]